MAERAGLQSVAVTKEHINILGKRFVRSLRFMLYFSEHLYKGKGKSWL